MTGHPTPVVTWSRSFGQLPQQRVQSNSSVIKPFDVRKSDSDNYLCTATNLLGSVVKRTVLVVVLFPRFTFKPPLKLIAGIGDTLTLNCSATGDPQPVISWKKQGSQLPVGCTQQINGALVIRSVTKEDTGNYICVATSAGVFDVETGTYIEAYPKDKWVFSADKESRKFENKRERIFCLWLNKYIQERILIHYNVNS